MAGVNLNEYDGQKERVLIPSGTKCLLRMNINPPESAYKSNLSPALTHKNDDVHYMNCEFEVVVGKYMGRKIFQNFTVEGGKKDEKTGMSIAKNISMGFLRSAWDAFNNLKPTDMSQEAVTKRQIHDYTSFHGMVFPAIVAEKEGDPGFNDKNEIYQVITPDKPEYLDLMNGKEVAPHKMGIIKSKKKAAAGGPGAARQGTKPDWAKDKPAAATDAAPAQTEPINPADNLPFNKPVTQQTDNRPAWAR